MRRLVVILSLVLGLTLLAAHPASAAVAASLENRASGSAAVADTRVSQNTRLSEEAVRENLTLRYDLASDSPVAAEGAADLVTVTHFTSAEGVAAIEGGALRAGSFVALPGEVGGLTATEVESALEIQSGRGAFSYTFQTPASNLVTPFNGPLTSGLRTQFQLVNPVPVAPGSFVPTVPTLIGP